MNVLCIGPRGFSWLQPDGTEVLLTAEEVAKLPKDIQELMEIKLPPDTEWREVSK